MKKTIGNLTCRKSQKTTSWESQNWPKIDENWKEKARKARKLGEKSSFWKARFFTLFLVGLCTHFLLKKKYSGRVRRNARESGKGKGWDNPRPQEHPSRNRVGSGCELFTLRASRRGPKMRGGVEILRIGGDDNNFFQCLIGSLCIALRPDSLQLLHALRLTAGDRKSMIIDEKYWKPMKLIEKLMELGAKGCPRRGTIHSGLRTARRDEASYAHY